MKKRVLSIILSLALIIGVLPAGVFTFTAAADTLPELSNFVGRWNGNQYTVTFDQFEGAVTYDWNCNMTLGGTRYAEHYGDTVHIDVYKGDFYTGYSIPPYWLTVTAENKYGEDIARSTINIKSPYIAQLDTPRNVYLSPTGVLTFDPVEHAGAYEVNLLYKGTHLKTYQYNTIPTANPYVDMSDWVCEKDGENFQVEITTYPEGFPDNRFGDYRESYYETSIKYSSATELKGTVVVNDDRTVTYGKYLKYLDERTSTPLHLQWQRFNAQAESEGSAWVNITESQKASYPANELRVVVTADGHSGSVASRNNSYTDKNNPYIATDFNGLKKVFNQDHDLDKTIYIKLGADITVTNGTGYLEANGGDVDLDLAGYTLSYHGKTLAFIRGGYGENARVHIRDSRRYDGKWYYGQIIFNHFQLGYHWGGGTTTGYSDDWWEYKGLTTTVLTGNVSLYGGTIINKSHEGYASFPAHESGDLTEYVYGPATGYAYGDGFRMYGGTIESKNPIRFESNKYGQKLGLYGGTIVLQGTLAVRVSINDKEGTDYLVPDFHAVKVVNESGNSQASFIRYAYTTGAGEYNSTRAFADLNRGYLSATESYTDDVKNSFATQGMVYNGDGVIQGPSFSNTYEIKTEATLKSLEFQITEPVAGEIPDYTITGAESDLYTTSLTWQFERMPNTFRDLEDKTAPFRTGLYYRALVTVTPVDGVRIPDITGTTTIGSTVADKYSNNEVYYFYSNYRLRDTYFDIWIGGTQVGRLNKGDVIGDGGSVQFYEKGEYPDPYFKYSKVLVFNNFNMIKDDYTLFDTGTSEGIIKAQILIDDDISIYVRGENSIGGFYSTAHGICLGSQNSVSFYGDGKFTVDESWNDNDAMIGYGSCVYFNEDVEFVLKGRYGARLEFNSDTAGFDLWNNAKVTCYAKTTEDDKDYPALQVSGNVTIGKHGHLICEQQYTEGAMSSWDGDFPNDYYDIKILKNHEWATGTLNPVTPYKPEGGINNKGGVHESECRYIDIQGKTVYATEVNFYPDAITVTPTSTNKGVMTYLKPSDAADIYDDLTFQSSDESILQIYKAPGDKRWITLLPQKDGVATVTATAPGGAKGTLTVTVTGYDDAEMCGVYVYTDVSDAEYTFGVDVVKGDVYGLPAEPAREGATFGGWYTDRALTQPYDPTAPIMEDTYLFPKWIPTGDYIPGDINGDGAVNNKDLTRLFQYLSDWDVAVNEAALDVNGDGSVNNKDLTRLFQYLSDWDVEIH